MEDIYKSTLLLIHSLTKMNGVCNQFYSSPNDENGEKIVEIVDKCEEKFLKVKEEIVRMVREAEDSASAEAAVEDIDDTDTEIEAIRTEGGFLINKQDRAKL